MKFIIKYVDKLLFKEYKLTAETLGCFRIFFSLYIIFIVGIPDYRILSELPDFIYDPPMLSIASLSSAFPEYSFLLVLSGLIFFLYFFVLFGYKTKYSSIFLTLLLLLGNSFYYSIGKINHGDMITVWVPLLMGIAGWGKAFSVDTYTTHTEKNKDNSVKGWPVFMLVSLLAFGMFTAGLPKLLGGWLDPSTQTVRGYLLNFYFVQERQLFLAPLFEKFSPMVIWESFDYFAVFLN